jgi:hypothetical protein
MDSSRRHPCQGYRVAPGLSTYYPNGSLGRQRPILKEHGLDLSSYFNGTLNIDIRLHILRMEMPEYTFQHVEWTDLHPPEGFSFSRCKMIYREEEYDGWVCNPQPETKESHFQNPSLVEAIARPIPGIRYGDSLQVLLNL